MDITEEHDAGKWVIDHYKDKPYDADTKVTKNESGVDFVGTTRSNDAKKVSNAPLSCVNLQNGGCAQIPVPGNNNSKKKVKSLCGHHSSKVKYSDQKADYCPGQLHGEPKVMICSNKNETPLTIVQNYDFDHNEMITPKSDGVTMDYVSPRTDSPVVLQKKSSENSEHYEGFSKKRIVDSVFGSAYDCTPPKDIDALEDSSQESERDGTELDFNIVVFSQDETDSRDSSNSDFSRAKLPSLVESPPNIILQTESSFSYDNSLLNCHEESAQYSGYSALNGLGVEPGSGPEKHYSVHLEASRAKSESPNYVVEPNLSVDSQPLEINQPNAENINFSIMQPSCIYLKSPSVIKMESQLKRDQFMASISNVKMESQQEKDQVMASVSNIEMDSQQKRDQFDSISNIKMDSQQKRDQFMDSISKRVKFRIAQEEKKRTLCQVIGCTSIKGLPSSRNRMRNHLLYLERSKENALRNQVAKKYSTNQRCLEYRKEHLPHNLQKKKASVPVVESLEKLKGFQEWRPIWNRNKESEEMHLMRQVFKPQYDETALITKAYSPGFIDSHCHLDFLFQRTNHSGTLKTYRLKCKDNEAFPVSYEGCVAVFCEPWTFRKISWWEELISEANIWGAFGCHPHHVSKFSQEEIGYLKFAIQNKKVVALGEIGLDYSERNNESEILQKEAFRSQLEIALQFKKPIVIHCRDAHRDCIALLKEMVPRDYIIHRHCFTDSWEEAQEWLDSFSNLYLGFTCLVTQSNRRGRLVREVVRHVPLDRILLETDAPYFRPLTPGFSHPGMAIHVAAQIAAVKNVDIQVVLQHARDNTSKMYGI